MLVAGLLNMLQEDNEEFIVIARYIGALIGDTPQDVAITAEGLDIDVVIKKWVV